MSGKIYTGLCIGGVWDGKAVAKQFPEFKVAKMDKLPMVLDAEVTPDFPADIEYEIYEWFELTADTSIWVPINTFSYAPTPQDKVRYILKGYEHNAKQVAHYNKVIERGYV